MPKAKRSKVWLCFAPKDRNNATCSKCNKAIASKGGNTSNLMKHLATHNVFLKAKACTVFECLRERECEPMPSTSAVSVGLPAPGDEETGPNPEKGDTDDDNSSLTSGS
ncbi:unnamed protein product [Pleuronectes platessa]|uniref:BED-type domain-containing protein n=1 Tax=Pleuronectes platessa TaxID=8262 RepID=A0A9N7Z9Q9_PLEPL|nr:unnamed protein product [Pleuronectes platessa]